MLPRLRPSWSEQAHHLSEGTDEAYLGTDIGPLLRDALGRSSRTDTSVTHVLGRTGMRDPSLFEPLSHSLLELKDTKARDLVAHLAAADEPAGLPRVLEGLRHSQPRIRRRAARALGFFVLDSAVATQGVPVLHEALRDSSEWVRRVATDSLGRMGPRALPAYPGLIRRLFENTAWIPLHARSVLDALGKQLQEDWRLDARNRNPGSAETLFKRYSGNLVGDQEERMRRLCLARERWHHQFCRPSPAPAGSPLCMLPEAAMRAARAAVTHGVSRRQQSNPAAEARDREREFAWLLAQLHTIGLEGVLTLPRP